MARELLEKAVRLDADNAAAHSALAEAWFLQGYDKKALAEAKAFDRSADLTGEGRLLIEARFRALSRDWDRAINLYSSLWTMEPDDPEAHRAPGPHAAPGDEVEGRPVDSRIGLRRQSPAARRALAGAD